MACVSVKIVTIFALMSVSAIFVGAAGQGRFKQLAPAELTADQRRDVVEAEKMTRSGTQGLYNVMLRSPILEQRMLPLEAYLRSETSVPRRLNEFAILIQARTWRSQVEWSSHYPLAMKAGLPEAVTSDLLAGRRPAGMQPDEAAVYDFCTELATSYQVSDPTYAAIKQVFTDQQIVDLTAVSGTYVTFAMLLAVGRELPPDSSKPLPALAAETPGQRAAPSQ